MNHLRFVTKSKNRHFHLVQYVKNADTFSSKGGVQQEADAEQNHSQLHVLQCLCTSLHQFNDTGWDRKQADLSSLH